MHLQASFFQLFALGLLVAIPRPHNCRLGRPESLSQVFAALVPQNFGIDDLIEESYALTKLSMLHRHNGRAKLFVYSESSFAVSDQ